jgi:hypothetical protein
MLAACGALVAGLVTPGLAQDTPVSPAQTTPIPTQSPLANPFPSPSPAPSPYGGYGYAAAGYAFGSATGGAVQPLPGSTGTPYPFPASSAHGFWIDLTGRVSPSYWAQVLYDNDVLSAPGRSLISYAQLRATYELHDSALAVGLAWTAVQRSTANAGLNGPGLGLTLLPSNMPGFHPYAGLFVYPGLHAAGNAGTLTAANAGLTYVPAHRGGAFLRIGAALRSGLPATVSPGSVTTLEIGLGTSL